jgi:hypothetical protein
MPDNSVKGRLGLLCRLGRLRDFGAGGPAADDAHGEQDGRSDQRNDPVPGVQEEENENECRKKGSIEQRRYRPARQKRPQLAHFCEIVCPAVTPLGGVNNRTFQHDGSNACLEPDREATEQPVAQGVERRAEDKGNCGDQGESDQRFNAAAAEHPIEHLGGIERQHQKQNVDRHAKGDDPRQRGSSRNQSKQRPLRR